MQENQLKCTKARNDYLLNLAAANAAMNKYYLQDISTLIDVSDTRLALCDFLGPFVSLTIPFSATFYCYYLKKMDPIWGEGIISLSLSHTPRSHNSKPFFLPVASLVWPPLQCCDLGFHLSVERVMNYYLASRGRIQKTEEAGLKQLEAAVTSLDPGGDRDALLQQHDAAFCLPFRFSYHPHEGDQVENENY